MKNPNQRTKNLYALVGPSGSGKTTLMRQLMKLGYVEAITTTTRACRGGEDRFAYNFVTVPRFKQMISEGKLAEYVSYCGNYYGCSFDQLNASDVIIIEPVGLQTIKQTYKARPIKTIGLGASEKELYRRLEYRADVTLERIREDRDVFADLVHQTDIYIYGASEEDTLQMVLGFLSGLDDYDGLKRVEW